MFPPQPFGWVAGRWVTSQGDTTSDTDRHPDYLPVTGQLTFTPILRHRAVADSTDYPGGAAGIINTPVQASLNARGQLIDADGLPHVALATGRYHVTYDFGLTSWPPHDIEVTAEHTIDEPLWIPTESPIPSGPAIVPVVTEAARIAAEAAAAHAEASADSAWQAVDTPGRQGPQGIPGPPGPPGEVTTSALTTALAGKVTGTGMTVRVDTTVGTRVLLDHPGGTLMLSGDTGWRNIKASANLHASLTLGTLEITRTDNLVTLHATSVSASTQINFGKLFEIPNGFRPSRNMFLYGSENTYIDVSPVGAAFATIGASPRSFSLQWRTTNPWPTVLPGTP